MKFIFTFLFAAISAATVAQWSDTHNQFYDSLHMSVCTQANDQLENFVVQSFPDSGYFLVWQDHRSNIYNTQIFAQKFDKHGNQLWATDGVPISSGTNNQHFTYSSNSDERNYSYAATDSAGGFYIAYADDSLSTYVWERATVQHIKNSGTGVFSGAGYIVATSNTANEHVSTQLIADGNKGFFIGLIKAANLYVFCFKDINGTMQYYGGSNGILNNNVVLNYNTGQCGNYTTAYYPATNVTDYKIYPDLQNGCNVVMTIGQNTGGNERIITGLNWLWRVKNNTIVNSTLYQKDSVIQYYNLMVSHSTLTCGSGATAYAYPADAIVSNGFASLNNLAYGAEHVKGTIVPTDGNINANIVATNQRDLINNNQVTTWFTKVICRPQEKFNDIPYAYTVDPFMPSTLSGGPPPGQNKLGTYTGLNNDTLLYDPSGSYFYEFCLASGGNKIYATAPIGNGGARNILLQGLQIDRVTSDSFALRSNTNNKMGVVIGKESYYMSYNQPQIAVNNIGSAIFI